MRPTMKNYPVSDMALGEFILSCFKLKVAAKKLAREIDSMCQKKCLDCKVVLTDDEAREGDYCDKCYEALQRDRNEELNPDDR